MKIIYIKLFLRLSIALGFISAVADRFGWWDEHISVWGNWQNFVNYTQSLLPYLPDFSIPYIAGIATVLELLFALLLLVGYQTQLIAKLSGILLLIFALSMTFFYGIKGTLDYSVYIASAAAFSLSSMTQSFLEIDSLFTKD
ncbi:Methylamine utilisation protein MauE [Zhouia amylolytica]|uniref:Methylamine utilisation protein MauE n=1 Tax=Zhouia amylolytica TaxID=376730 RepID=A0A1I6UIJ1_9FLAO|nr:DoxX family protein [Zhouia amylolytica]SFT01243.1 Methylamine utilisation protein MauE [Zhouia amylolytica]